MSEAVKDFQRTVASVQRKDMGEAVTEFLTINAPLARESNGERSQISAEYAYNRELQLRRFADAFPHTAVCDLTKEHLDKFFETLGQFSAKTRNHYRMCVRQWLQWAVRKDFLPVTHRLGEADGLRAERANTAEIGFYTPRELAALLENADDTWRPLIAIGGLAGLRTAELLRLDWADVWRVEGHIEITASKSKTRQRRLVIICPALASWLEPFRANATGKPWHLHKSKFQKYSLELCQQVGVKRKDNGLRHAYCTYHFALHANENLTAQQTEAQLRKAEAAASDNLKEALSKWMKFDPPGMSADTKARIEKAAKMYLTNPETRSLAKIADEFKVSRKTVSGWFKTFTKETGFRIVTFHRHESAKEHSRVKSEPEDEE